MRVLLVNDSSTPSGGAEIMSLTLRDAMRARGHEAKLFSSRAMYGDAPIAADATCYGTVHPFRQVLRMANPSAYLGLRRILSEFEPDVVHVRMMTTQLSPMILLLLQRFPSLYHATWHEMICPTGMKMLPSLRVCQATAGVACWRHGCVSATAWPLLMVQGQLLNRWRNMFTRMVSNSYYLAQRLEEAGWGRSEVIWNGVPEVLQRGPLGDSPEIGFSGRLIPEKGAETLIQAFAQLKPRIDVPMRLLVIGDGPERTRLERLCSKLSVASMVTFTGAMTREESERRLQRAWVQVVPSICQESFGLVAAEAQMRGTAAIVTRRGGLPEIIEAGKTGTLVDPQDPMQLAEAIWPYLVDRSKAERFGQAGRERALRVFHLDTCVSKFLELYDRVILEHRGKTSKGDTL